MRFRSRRGAAVTTPLYTESIVIVLCFAKLEFR